MTAVGVPKAKLMVGFPFFGTTCSGVTDPRQMGASCGSETPYSSIIRNYNLSGRVYDSTAHAAWVPIGGGYLTYDDAASLTDKVNWVKSNGFGGWIMFNLNDDYAPTQNAQHPLLAAVQTAMGTNSSSYNGPSITSTSPLASGTVGTPYSQTVDASGTTPMTWAVTSGALPSGLSLNGSSGVISGTPSTATSSSFTIEASNAAGTNSKQLTLTTNSKSAAASNFKLESKNSGLCLDVTGMSTSEGVQLQQWACSGGSNQIFHFAAVQGGYEIIAQNSGLLLNVEGGVSATENGAPIIQWPNSGETNEIWNLVPYSDGSYSIKSLSSGKCVDVTGDLTSDGAKIQQWQCTGNANQKWSLVAVQ
jgi:glucosylceramidase